MGAGRRDLRAGRVPRRLRILGVPSRAIPRPGSDGARRGTAPCRRTHFGKAPSDRGEAQHRCKPDIGAPPMKSRLFFLATALTSVVAMMGGAVYGR